MLYYQKQLEVRNIHMYTDTRFTSLYVGNN